MGASNVIINGAEADKAVDELQAAVGDNMKISRDSKSGELSYTRSGKLSKNGKKLSPAIDYSSITVDIQANDTEVTRGGDNFFGGAFLGNTVTTASDGTSTVVAEQDINPVMLGKADNFTGKSGTSTLHEVTEAYEGPSIHKKRV